MNRIALSACALVILLTGCAGYRIGSTLPPGINSVYVPTFMNESGEPDLEGATTAAVIEEFQREGTLSIGTEKDADAILEVRIAKYDLKPIAYSEDRATEPSEYRMSIYVAIAFKLRKTGKVIVKNPWLRGRTKFEVTGDFTLSKQEALPDAAADLAHEIVEKVVEAW